jgi:hypothetical protein
VRGAARKGRPYRDDVLPSSVPVRGPNGPIAAFMRTQSQALGTLSCDGGDGAKTWVAGWEGGGPTASLTLLRDTTPPTLTVTALGRGVWFRC